MSVHRITETRSASLLVLIVALVLALPLLLAPWEDHESRARWEKRPLTDADELRRSIGTPMFFDELEAFVDDHLYGALAVNKAYRRFQFRVFHDSPVPNVALANGGLVFLTSHRASHPLEALEKFCSRDGHHAEQLHQALEQFSQRLAAAGTDLVVAIVPSKLGLYPDRLPESLPPALRRQCLDVIPDQTVPARVLAAERSFELHYPLQAMAALRDEPYFYPPGNFHADSQLNHEFAREFLSRHLGFDPARWGGVGEVVDIEADLLLMGFSRQTRAWQYRYDDYGVRRLRKAPDWLKPVYKSARGFSRYQTERPISDRKALLLSDSFGAFLAGHLAPGYASLTHVNIRSLRPEEREPFLETALRETEADELLILVHDAGFPNQALRRLLDY